MELKIIWASLWHKKLNSILCVVLLALGASIISLLIKFENQFTQILTKNVAGVDMVVGAKGSPLQLILSTVFQIDNPTGNVPLREVENLKRNPQVKSLIPVSMGDNHQGFRIVGTTTAYLDWQKASLESGAIFEKSMEVVIGSKVLNLQVGDSFQSTHGLDAEGEVHTKQMPFVVKGILKETGKPIDNLIVTSLESIWDVHHDDSPEKEVTGALVQFRSPLGLMTIPRGINENTVMQAALPNIEIDRLLQLFGSGIKYATYLAYLIIAISLGSIFVAMYSLISEGKDELALLVSIGATRAQLFQQSLGKGLVISIIGLSIGLLLCRIILTFIAGNMQVETVGLWNLENSEMKFLVLTLFLSILAAAIPSWSIYRLNLSQTLSKNA